MIVSRQHCARRGDVGAGIHDVFPGQADRLHVPGVDLTEAEINRLALAAIVARGLDSLRDLPDLEALHDAGLLQDGRDMGMPVAGDGEEWGRGEA